MTMSEAPVEQPTLYQLLQLHPAAPLDLVSAAYWRLADQLQQARKADSAAAVALHRLTKAYGTLTDPLARLRYDESIGIARQSAVPEVFSRPRSLLGRIMKRKQPRKPRDYYQVLRVHPSAGPAVIEVAIPVMRDYYVHLVRTGAAPAQLLDAVTEAREALIGAGPGVAQPPPVNGESLAHHNSPDVARDLPAAKVDGAQSAPKAEPSPSHEKNGPHVGRGFLFGLAAVGVRWVRWLVWQTGRLVRSTATWFARRSRAAWRSSRSLAARTTRSASQVLMAASARLAVRDEPEPRIASDDAILQRISTTSDTKEHASVNSSVTLARLVVTDGPCAGRQFALNGDPVILGSENCEIDLPGLASHHVRLWFRDGQVVICTLADHPATYVNGRTVAWAIIEKGDQLKIGAHGLSLELLPVSG